MRPEPFERAGIFDQLTGNPSNFKRIFRTNRTSSGKQIKVRKSLRKIVNLNLATPSNFNQDG